MRVIGLIPILFCLAVFSNLNCFSQVIGSGNALDFDGVNDHVDCSGLASAASLNLPTAEISLEAWVNPRTYQTWDAIVSFLQDNGSFERGWDLEMRNSGKFAFALATTGTESMTYLETTNSYNTDQWYHVAGTYDGVTMRIYVNGILENESTAQSGSINYEDSWLTIGMYRDDNEDNASNAQIDEVRIWNHSRDIEQIRQYMCQRLEGNEAGLVHYYPLDESTGFSVEDLAGNADGTMTNMNEVDHIDSPVPLGDESEFLYTSDWSNQTLSLNSANNGSVNISEVSALPKGVHLYRVDSVPVVNSPLDTLEGTNSYFGVYIADDVYSEIASYDVEWNYSSFSEAVANESDLLLLNRPNKLVSDWASADAELNSTDQVILKNGMPFHREFVLSKDPRFLCDASTDFEVASAGIGEASLGWTTGSGGSWNIEYGVAGSGLGNGTIINTNTAPYTLTGLQQETLYEAYLQDDCGNGTSYWVGPITFSSQQCTESSDIQVDATTDTSATLSWLNTAGTSWNIQWGNSGFPLGFGITTTVNSNPATLYGLAPNTTYEFYLQDVCDQVGTSEYQGPYSFTTAPPSGLQDLNETVLQVYPNPTGGRVFINLDNKSTSGSFLWTVYDITGKVIQESSNSLLANGIIEIDLASASAGTYFLHIVLDNSTQVEKLIKN